MADTKMSRFRDFGKSMILIGLIAFVVSWFYLDGQMGGIEVERTYGNPDSGSGTILVHHVIQIVAALVALVGVLVIFLVRKSAPPLAGESEIPEGLKDSVADRLGRIKELHDQGLISDAELTEQRKRVLDSQ